MFGMPNLGESSSAAGEAELAELSQPEQLQGPGVYQLKRRASPKPAPSVTSKATPAAAAAAVEEVAAPQQDDLWTDLDLELDSASPAQNRQTYALLDVLLDNDIWDQHTALGDVELPRELLERSSVAIVDDLELNIELADEPLTEVELFGGDFPAHQLKPPSPTYEPKYNTNAPASCTHSTSSGLEESTAAAQKRYYLVCEENGQERRVLLDAKLVELVAQLIFEPVR